MKKLVLRRALLMAGVLLLAQAPSAFAIEPAGSVLGWVKDSRGTPVAGALVSLFAKGMRGGGLVTFSDQSGRFALSALPPGSYTVRAVGKGLQAATARRILVLPNQEFVLALSLPAFAELDDAEAAERRRELTWLVRHKSRSVLEQRSVQSLASQDDQAVLASATSGPRASDLGGSVEVLAGTLPGSDPGSDLAPLGAGALRFEGRFTDGARFTVGGVLTENDEPSWRMAAELAIDDDDEQSFRVGAGYGTRLVRALSGTDAVATDGRAVGVLFLEDRLALGERVSASIGLRQTYIGFVQDHNHLDPSLSVTLRPSGNTRLHLTADERTVVPGGDFLTLSAFSNAPAILYAALPSDLTADRVSRLELAADHSFGGTLVGVRAWSEGNDNQLVNAYVGRGASRQLRIFNAGASQGRGFGVDVSRRIGRSIRGSLGYSFGRVTHEMPVAFVSGPSAASLSEGAYHDLVGRLEAAYDVTDTRLIAFYRLNLMASQGDEVPASSVRTSRFDVRVSQALPFLGALTRADWELLLAVRNVFYEAAEGGTLDELAVVAPPTRLLGGISVRF